jgi:hypothetical protein
MPWSFTNDVEAYADRVWDLLARSPVKPGHDPARLAAEMRRASTAVSA